MKTDMSLKQLSRDEVGQSDSDVSFPSQSKDWLYTETELWPLVTLRVSGPFLATENTIGMNNDFKSDGTLLLPHNKVISFSNMNMISIALNWYSKVDV